MSDIKQQTILDIIGGLKLKHPDKQFDIEKQYPDYVGKSKEWLEENLPNEIYLLPRGGACGKKFFIHFLLKLRELR